MTKFGEFQVSFAILMLTILLICKPEINSEYILRPKS